MCLDYQLNNCSQGKDLYYHNIHHLMLENYKHLLYMDKNKFLLIVILTVVSMVSILLVQFSWISQINELNIERFEKDINDVLFTVNQKLEEREILILTRENLEAKFKISRSNETGGVELIESIFSKRTIQDGEMETKQNSLQFDLESSNKNIDSDNDIKASILVEDFNEVTVDTLIQRQINKVLDRSEMIQIISVSYTHLTLPTKRIV